MLVASRIRVIEKQRAHHRHAGARGFLGELVEIRHEAVTLLNKAAANVFVLLASHPRLLIAASFFRMISVDGLKGRDLNPFGEEIGSGRSRETANICAAEGEAADAEALEHRAGHAQMIPCAAVVSGPCSGVALSSGIGCPRQYKGARIRFDFAQAIVSRARVFHSIDVVNLSVARSTCTKARLVDAMQDIERD